MTHYKYLIIGGGMTAAAAMEGIRQLDVQSTIGLISAEKYPPYNRPPLSKRLWQGEPLESIWRTVADEKATLHLGRRAQTLDVDGQRVVDDHGEVYTYEQLLLATGGRPRRFAFGDDGITYMRTLADYHHLRSLARPGAKFAVIGGGFIGSEMAAALSSAGCQVTMIFADSGIGARIFPASLSRFLTDMYREKGIEILAGDSVSDMEQQDEQAILTLASGRTLVVDGVVAGIGLEPNTELAEQAGLHVTDGIWVDESLRTSDTNIYAAGDVANFYSPALKRRMRVEHEDNANSMGEMAGRAMAGAQVAYHHLPFFYSDLFDMGYEAVGLVNSEMEMITDWLEPNREGMIYYLEDNRIHGVVLWNVWGQVDAARTLIAQPELYSGKR